MKCLSALLLGALLITLHSTAQDIKLKSPDKRMEVKVQLKDGQLFYTVSYRGKVVMQPSQLGISRTDGDFYKDLKWNGNSMSARVNESCAMRSGYAANDGHII